LPPSPPQVHVLSLRSCFPKRTRLATPASGCISGLVGYLRNSDEDIVIMAAQAIQFLSVNRVNRPKMLKFSQVIPDLTALTTSANSKIRDFASASLSNLNACVARQSRCR
jgi:hypothetical protein